MFKQKQIQLSHFITFFTRLFTSLLMQIAEACIILREIPPWDGRHSISLPISQMRKLTFPCLFY